MVLYRGSYYLARARLESAVVTDGYIVNAVLTYLAVMCFGVTVIYLVIKHWGNR